MPASRGYRRDRRNSRWCSAGSPNRNLFLAAGITLTVIVLLAIATSYFFAPDPLIKLMLSGHKDGSRAMATNMHERRFKWQDRFKKQRRRRDLAKTCDPRQKISALADDLGDEELGEELGVVRNEPAADAPKDETQAVVRPVDQTPAPQSNASPTKALQRSFSGLSSRTVSKSNSKAHSRANFKTNTKANLKIKKHANFKIERNANFKTNRNANFNTDRNANVKVDTIPNFFVKSNANPKAIGNLNFMVTGNANSQVSSNTNTKANNVADTRASTRASTRTTTRSRKRMKGL
ncbi:hypothetical protein ACHAPV_005510 [Trichoderma viride]